VFGGMLAAAVFGIFVIPMLYVVFQRMREWTAARGSPTRSQASAPPVSPTPTSS
jgi:hydrophobic/amphiphilic exporter-1 (mainly G- bacteria), HAE1 family